MPTTAKKTTRKNLRGGFTLVELCIVIALVAIVSLMIVSFSVLFGGNVAKSEQQYAFMDNVGIYKQKLLMWISERDTLGSKFTVYSDDIKFSDGNAPSMGEDVTIAFELSEDNDRVLKCTLKSKNESLDLSQTFILTVQCGSFVDGGSGE